MRAYSGSCAEVLKQCEKLSMTDCTRAEVVIDYSLLKPLRKALAPHAREESVEYGDKVALVYLFPTVSSTTISDIVSQTTLGKAKFTVKEQLLSNFAIDTKFD